MRYNGFAVYIWLTTPQWAAVQMALGLSLEIVHRPVWEPGIPASLLTRVVRCIDSRSRERGGRAPLQKGENRYKLLMTPNRIVCPGDSRFQPITKDLRRLREMPSFALSRRQRGFESRWGQDQITLTRSDTATSQPGLPQARSSAKSWSCASNTGETFTDPDERGEFGNGPPETFRCHPASEARSAARPERRSRRRARRRWLRFA